MRINLLLIFGLSLLFFSCSQDQPTTISGRLTNIQDTTISIIISADPITRLQPSGYKDVFTINRDGTFSIPIKMEYPSTVTLISENFNFHAGVILTQGGEISLSADCDNVKETLEFHGINSGLNTFNLKLQFFYTGAYNEIRQHIDSYSLFKNGLDSLQSISLMMLEDFSITENLSKKEMLWLKSLINYRKFSSLSYRAYDLNAHPDDSTFQFFQTLNLNDQESIQVSYSYNEAIMLYILHEVNAKGIVHSSSNDNTEYFKSFYQTIDEKLTGKVKDVILTIFISELLKNNDGFAAEYYERYLVDCKSPKIVMKTSDLYVDYLEVMNQTLSENVNFISTDQQRPMEVLSQFENKVVYLDFWASWCSPCLKGIPYTKELAEHYKNANLVVLYIGNSDQKANLINAIKKHNIEGNHFILNEEETEIWRKEFEISGIPTYVMINKSGKVHDKNAPDPKTEEAYQQIDSLLLLI